MLIKIEAVTANIRIELRHALTALHSRYFSDQSGAGWLSIQFQIRLHRLYKKWRPDVGLRTRDQRYQINNHWRCKYYKLFLPGAVSSSPLTINPSAPFISNIPVRCYGRDKQSAL